MTNLCARPWKTSCGRKKQGSNRCNHLHHWSMHFERQLVCCRGYDDIYNYGINIDKPRYDQSTYIGRAKHFFITTNPLNILKSSSELDEAKSIVHKYKSGDPLPGLTVDGLWRAKHLYDSAFHPDTGEKMIFFGRMSFQVPGNMFITGCLLQFYKTTSAVVFWQWFNQTFNAVVNYTNRSGDSPISLTRLSTSYVLATTGAVATALSINKQVQRFPPLFGRFVPFIAVAAANCINIPCMRSLELTEGTTITDENGEVLGQSRVVGQRAIFKVVVSRILMAVPGMIFPPILMDALEKRGTLARYPWLGAPLQVTLCGIFLTFMTPMCCALFPQVSSIAFDKLESDAQAKIRELRGDRIPKRVYYNKGL
ncbi:Sideroflexin-1 [Clonorchis sinensis]|uniref:Sidoreflexin n=2 Tax=Clonorchis sinensis TaxID=79923 RepID=A0A3R7HBF2_CLOSI|nr:Sideroflexin-1 [Clonorchis sinensis]